MDIDAMLTRLNEIEIEARTLRPRVRAIQDACEHTWGAPYSCPTTTRDAISLCIGPDGPSGEYGPERSVPRWGRKCNKCKKIEYTDRTKTVAVEPDFNPPTEFPCIPQLCAVTPSGLEPMLDGGNGNGENPGWVE
jgi:hypothetical protein